MWKRRKWDSVSLAVLFGTLALLDTGSAQAQGFDVTTPYSLQSTDDFTQYPEVSTEMWLGKGQECLMRVFLVYKLTPPPIVYECWCLDICHESEKEKFEKENDARKDALKELWGAHYHVRTALYSVLLAVGAAGNILVLITVGGFMGKATVTNMYIVNLAIADLLVILICIPFKIIEEVYMEWDLGEAACKLFGGLYFGSFMCSVFTLCCISLERFMAICYPMKTQFSSTKSRTIKICIGVWVAGVILSSPSYYFFNLHKNNSCLVGERGKDGQDTRFYFYLYILCVIFFIPAVLMSIAYFRTAFALWRSIAVQRGLKNNSSNQTKNEKSSNADTSRLQVIRMLIIVLIIFIVCWAPYLFGQVIFNTHYFNYDIPVERRQNLLNANRYFALLSLANSAINPILYGLTSRLFRNGFLRCLTCGHVRLIPMTSYATTTRFTNNASTHFNNSTTPDAHETTNASTHAKQPSIPENKEASNSLAHGNNSASTDAHEMVRTENNIETV